MKIIKRNNKRFIIYKGKRYKLVTKLKDEDLTNKQVINNLIKVINKIVSKKRRVRKEKSTTKETTGKPGIIGSVGIKGTVDNADLAKKLKVPLSHNAQIEIDNKVKMLEYDEKKKKEEDEKQDKEDDNMYKYMMLRALTYQPKNQQDENLFIKQEVSEIPRIEELKEGEERLEEISYEIQEVKDQYENGQITQKEYNEIVKDLKKEKDGLDESLKKFKKQIKKKNELTNKIIEKNIEANEKKIEKILENHILLPANTKKNNKPSLNKFIKKYELENKFKNIDLKASSYPRDEVVNIIKSNPEIKLKLYKYLEIDPPIKTKFVNKLENEILSIKDIKNMNILELKYILGTIYDVKKLEKSKNELENILISKIDYMANESIEEEEEEEEEEDKTKKYTEDQQKTFDFVMKRIEVMRDIYAKEDPGLVDLVIKHLKENPHEPMKIIEDALDDTEAIDEYLRDLGQTLSTKKKKLEKGKEKEEPPETPTKQVVTKQVATSVEEKKRKV